MKMLLTTLLFLSFSTQAHVVVSDPLDSNATSVIVTINGVDDGACGPGAEACMKAGTVFYDVSSLTLLGAPFTVSAKACNSLANCSISSEEVTLDPATFAPHSPKGITVIEIGHQR